MKKIIFASFILAAVLLFFLFRRHFGLNLVVITLDTTRRDYLSAYNPSAKPTPNFDRIATKSVLFENAYSLIPITFPAHTSMFLSLPPHRADIFGNGDFLTDKTLTLAELLRDRGYKTGAFVSIASLKKEYGLSRGFQVYEEMFRQTGYGIAEEVNREAIPWIRKNSSKRFFTWVHYSDPHYPYAAPDTPPDTEIFINGVSVAKVCIAKKLPTQIDFIAKPNENIILFKRLNSEDIPISLTQTRVFAGKPLKLEYLEGWNRLQKQERLFQSFTKEASLRVVNDNESPGKAQLAFIGQLARNVEDAKIKYAAEVRYMDTHLGRLWDTLSDLGLLDKTIVLITADHGECLGERNHIGHLYPLIEPLSHIPLIIYYPKQQKAARLQEMVCHLDILPTLLDLMNVKGRKGMSGISLSRLVLDGTSNLAFAEKVKSRAIFFETYKPEVNQFALLKMPWKVTLTHRTNWNMEFYNLLQDPKEERNLADSPEIPAEVLRSMRSTLEQYAKESEAIKSKHRNPDLDEEDKEALRNLGYVTN